jgi:hypothetical protein
MDMVWPLHVATLLCKYRGEGSQCGPLCLCADLSKSRD